ncbi:MAG: SDR family oxidoreductase [Chlamydiia bacterium]|nr:SDR family oxidoreductase [Chlamydiia bacterium]
MILITGTTSGIGHTATAKLLETDAVTGIARRPNPFPDHPHYTHLQADLTTLTDYPKLTPTAIIANAGAGLFGSLENFATSDIHNLIHLNLLAPILLIKHYLPQMKQQEKGKIILIGSEAALNAHRKGTVYCATKFALRGFAQALRHECASNNIQVTLINPGMVDTPFYEHQHFTPGPSHLTAEDVVDTLIHTLRAPYPIDEINLSPQTKTLNFKKER